MMEKTLGGFCRDLMDDEPYGQAIDPEGLAGRFVDYFGLSARPSLEELTALAEWAGFGKVQEGKMEGLKGAHLGQPGGEYHIYHRDDLWEGSKAHTVLHELYEITLERMAEIHSPGMPVPSVRTRLCRPVPWRSGPPTAAERNMPRRTGWPPLPDLSCGRAAWPR